VHARVGVYMCVLVCIVCESGELFVYENGSRYSPLALPGSIVPAAQCTRSAPGPPAAWPHARLPAPARKEVQNAGKRRAVGSKAASSCKKGSAK